MGGLKSCLHSLMPLAMLWTVLETLEHDNMSAMSGKAVSHVSQHSK